MLLVAAVRKVEARDVHSCLNELADNFPRAAGGSNGGNNFCAAHVSIKHLRRKNSSRKGAPPFLFRPSRKPLLKAGIELYEIKPTTGMQRARRPGSLGEPSGSGSVALHAKTFSFDRRIGFIGSYNLDPRSS